MYFSIKNEFRPNSCKEIVVLKRLVDFLENQHIKRIIFNKEDMCSFDMNDLLLVSPRSSIRSIQKVTSL